MWTWFDGIIEAGSLGAPVVDTDSYAGGTSSKIAIHLVRSRTIHAALVGIALSASTANAIAVQQIAPATPDDGISFRNGQNRLNAPPRLVLRRDPPWKPSGGFGSLFNTDFNDQLPRFGSNATIPRRVLRRDPPPNPSISRGDVFGNTVVDDDRISWRPTRVILDLHRAYPRSVSRSGQIDLSNPTAIDDFPYQALRTISNYFKYPRSVSHSGEIDLSDPIVVAVDDFPYQSLRIINNYYSKYPRSISHPGEVDLSNFAVVTDNFPHQALRTINSYLSKYPRSTSRSGETDLSNFAVVADNFPHQPLRIISNYRSNYPYKVSIGSNDAIYTVIVVAGVRVILFDTE